MGSLSHQLILCDGCGCPASPEHIAERLARLELATRFRPVHIDVLFVALAPLGRLEDDFYGPPRARDFFDSLMDAVGISSSVGGASPGNDQPKGDEARLAEFQRKGYYLSYVSECPIIENGGNPNWEVSAIGQTFVPRVRFNYKPKRIALLGSGLAPLMKALEIAGLGPLLLLHRGQPLTVPRIDDLPARAGFQRRLSIAATADGPVSEL